MPLPPMLDYATLQKKSERAGIENKRFPLTGRVLAVEVAADGDLHLALRDATGDKPGISICDVPAQSQWREIQTTVFSWTPTRFPLHIRSTRELTINETPIITVIGNAFYDVGHTPKGVRERAAAIKKLRGQRPGMTL